MLFCKNIDNVLLNFLMYNIRILEKKIIYLYILMLKTATARLYPCRIKCYISSSFILFISVFPWQMLEATKSRQKNQLHLSNPERKRPVCHQQHRMHIYKPSRIQICHSTASSVDWVVLRNVAISVNNIVC